MSFNRSRNSSGQNKSIERWQYTVNFIDTPFYPLYIRSFHSACFAQFGKCGISCQIRTYDKQLILDKLQ